ncbi:ketoacyl-synt-domain-containing protein [Podospora australis]|uniref:Ketoacyl-synt-domain-containing protein n=1 Tax=Podospora australis TaxID=1536484 RepID=A0AAN7AGC0_9PEZI|nr:ketoacyl-synt-domain-containing protein [Podospora australis]
MDARLKLYLFGDQTFDIQPHQHQLLRARYHPVAQDFVVKAYDAIRTEIYTLPRKIRDDLPRFTCADDLILWDSGSTVTCVPLDMAVTCMYQLAIFMSREADSFGKTETPCILGLCTGTLAAAAVACSQNTTDLVFKAVAAVTAAFRTGMRVESVGKSISPSTSPGQSWSVIIPGLDASDVVQLFNEQTILPSTTRPYISAVASNGITASGPPASLEQLLRSKPAEKYRSKSIPIHAPYHAPHLYSDADVADIIKGLAGEDSQSEGTFLFGMNGPVKARGFSAALSDAVGQILLHPIHWGRIVDQLRKHIEAHSVKSFAIAPIGSVADQLIYTALQLPSLGKPSPSVDASPSQPTNPGQVKLAIVGMSGRFPGANDNEAFWDLLSQGLDVHKPVPPLRWDARTHVDPTGAKKNTSATPYGCWLDDAAAFDARFFNISPREAPQIDPAQRLALMAAYEAMEQAGLVPGATPSTRHDRVGVFFGVTSNDWMETNSAQNIDTYFIPGGNRAFIPGRVNYFFKFSGPSYAVDTACSSSLAGIHLACNALWRGDVDTAIAGGTNVLTNPDFTAGLDRGHFLSRTGNCKTFDDEADGYCRGEGIGAVIIKRLEDAQADKDPVLGVILGAYTNHSAESESITRPHVGAQRAIFRKILNQAAVDPRTVSYVEMHGTGTQAGDAGEMSSVLDVFAPPPQSITFKARAPEQTLHIGSAKSNIGHGEAASGVSSLIKVLLMMQKNAIVPHCGIKTRINRKFPTDLDQRRVKIALKQTPWTRETAKDSLRRVFVNNFSAAGGNTALLIEDAPLLPVASEPSEQDPRGIHLVGVSAKNGVSLQGNLRSLAAYLDQNPAVPLGQLSYTTTARRIHHPHRIMLAGTSVAEMRKQIDTALADSAGMTRPKSAPKVLFAFTGQGAQYPGMGKQLLEASSVFRGEMHRLDRLAQGLGFPTVIPLIQSDEQDMNTAGFAPVVVQLANVCMQITLCKLWESWGITPMAVVGHSLGEYAALAVAGVLSEADAIYLVGKRAEVLSVVCQRDTHAMLVVRGSVQEIASVLGSRRYETACINSPTETVLAGTTEEIWVLKDLLSGAGLKTTPLKVPFAFHSSQMDPMLSQFRSAACGVTFHKPRIPVVCALDGRIRGDKDTTAFDPEYLARHTRQAVNMMAALLEAQKQQLITDQTTVLEIGPHPAVSAMVKSVLGNGMVCLASAQRGRSAWQVLGQALKTLYLAGVDIAWAEYHKEFKANHNVLALPAYSWDLKDYWMQYVNDWSLRKGDPPVTVPMHGMMPELNSTTIHRVVSEDAVANKVHLVVEADIVRKDLSPLVQGHEVDGIPLCTPSVYADIALTLGTYLRKRYRSDKPEDLVDVSDMTVFKALILREGAASQLIQAHSETDWSSGSSVVKFMSFDSKQKLQEHARCVVRFRDRSFRQVLQEKAANIKQKMQALRDGIATEKAARFNRPMVYRAIRPLARFHDDYRAIDEIVLNSTTLEASSRLSYGTVKRGGKFHTHPAVIDSLTQSCGFAMNCNDATDLDKDVYMNHGWGSLQIFEPLDFDKVYTTYTQMEEGKDKLWHGDVVIFDGDTVVAYFGQICIQQVPRRVLKVILSIESGSKSQKKKQQSAPPQRNLPTPKSAPLHTPPLEAQGPSDFSKALFILSEESGIAVADFTDGVVFSDVGIDSLLGLIITARFKEELDLDMDFNALFFEYPTVADLRTLLSGSSSLVADPASDSESGPSSYQTSTAATGVTTPDGGLASPGHKVDFQRALEIISEESGIAVAELSDDTSFADAGVDSLLSLVIVSRFRDELELDIQHEALFLECPAVEDLRHLLLGSSESPDHQVDSVSPSQDLQALGRGNPKILETRTPVRNSDLQARRDAVDGYVTKYTANFSAPTPLPLAVMPDPNAKVILVTGASGSLGSNLVYLLSQRPDVKQVVCLNRAHKTNTDPTTRQYKAMREKGIRFPEDLKHKLLVLQADSAQPMLGLPEGDYKQLVDTVTHAIHNAWPMSAKRALSGFEPQFATMRGLIDLARDVASHRPPAFRFTFQMVSSIGVVGHYRLGDTTENGPIMVSEDRVDVDSVLPNGYGDAKWACERMLDATLHQHSRHFRPMVVRLGQIAGSKTSGYWNPMEHFGFLVKSSQTLNALPDVAGKAYWTPVNDVAASLLDLALADNSRDAHAVYHVENPVGQPWKQLNVVLADALGIPPSNLIPFEEWVERVRRAPQKNNPAATLLEFLDDNYLRLSCGGLVLDVKHALEHSESLRNVGPVSDEVVRKYIHIWREIGFIN